MAAADFITRFRALHEKAKLGTLTPPEKMEYEQQRRELGRLMLVAQQMNHGGQTLRNALRIAQLIKVELDLGGPSPEKTSTVDLAGGGFAVLLAFSQPVGRVVKFTVQLPAFGGGMRPLSGTAKVASSRPQGGLFRVSFSFADLAPADREYLEIVIIDFVLRRFSGGG